MGAIQQARDFFKKVSSSYVNNIAKPMAIGVSQTQQYFNPTDQNKYVDTFFNKASNIPRYQLPQNFLPRTNNKVLQFGQGLVRGAIESPLNIPRNLIAGSARLQQEQLNLLRGKGYNLGNAFAGVGNLGEAALDLGTFGIGKSIAKGAIQQTAKTGALSAIKRGIAQGAVVGGVGGTTYGLGNQYNKKLDIGEILMGAGAGALIGGTLGGGIAGLGSIKKNTTYSQGLVDYLRDARGRFRAGDMPVKPPKMSNSQWNFQLKANESLGRNPYEPIYQSDLQKIISSQSVGLSVKKMTKFQHEENLAKSAQQPLGITKVPTGELQTPKTQLQSQPVQPEVPMVKPQVQGKVVAGEGGSSRDIIPLKDKYAFNINKPRLGLTGESAKKLDAVVEQMRPVLAKRKGAPLTDKEIITGGRKAVLLDQVMGRDQAKEFSARLQATRNFVRTASKQKGVTPEYLAQLEILSSTAADTGRKLRSFATNAEDATIKETVLKDLQSLGIRTKQLIEASKNVDWDNAEQVTEFYRKFKPASILEMLEEYRYTNMLSSPSTQIVNAFSNLIQGGIVTPVEKTITGGLDFVRSRLTGTEQKYFAGQGVDFAKGYWKALPEGWSKFKSIITGQGGLSKPDVDFIPTGTGKLHKIYTTPLRALEATDQLFRSMVIGGETASLKRTGVTGAEAGLKAEAEATYRTFRQAFDPEGKLGQGGLLKLWDRWNIGVNQLRKLPGGKWIVPFLQTPTNILKQGVEYSPLGIATIPGSKEPMVQLSKAVLGSGVFVAASALADSGLTTWDTPTNKKDRDAFYAAGLQPYSVRVGDRWVSYSKLGPLSYPIAMAAAMKWAKDNGANENILKTAGMGVGGFLQFFADQSYMQGIGDVIDAVRGDEFKQGRSLANIPSQLIPYRALQGWLSRLIDPVYRKTSGGGVLEQAGKSIISQTPFASKTLEPYTTSNGESLRSEPLFNAFSPVKTSVQTETYLPASSKGIYGEFNKLNTPQEKAALWDQMVKQGRISKDNVTDIKKLFKDDEIGVTYNEKDIREMGVKDGSRARSVVREFNKLKTPEEKAALWAKYVKAGIITKDVAKQIKQLLEVN